MTKIQCYGIIKFMKINLNDLTLIIDFENDNEKKLIKKFITYKDNSNCFCGGKFHQERAVDVCLGKDIKDKFVCFSGLTKEIILFAKGNNILITEFNDKREHFAFQEKEHTYDELRELFPKEFDYVEHQIRALQSMLKTNNGLVVAATSAGKSQIIKSFMKLTNLPTLVLTDRATLGAQLAEEFRNYGLDCGFCCGKGVKDGYNMVSTIQSVKKITDFTRFKCLIVDECHKSSSDTFQNFFKQFGCPLKFGFTASPFNGDYLKYAKIRQFLGYPLVKVGAKELMDNGVMAKAKIYLIKNSCEETIDYPSAYEINITHGKRRNEKIAKIANSYDDGVAILVRTLEHGEELLKLIPDAVFLKGDTPLNERIDAIKKFNNGEIKKIIGSSILNEGISISNMKVLIMASSGKAITQTIQKIGRVLRITKEKREGIFYDFLDMDNKFLERQAKKRLTLYKKEGFNDYKILDDV